MDCFREMSCEEKPVLLLVKGLWYQLNQEEHRLRPILPTEKYTPRTTWKLESYSSPIT